MSRIIFALLLTALLASCALKEDIAIRIINNSDKRIDSAIVFIQTSRIVFKDIKPGASVTQNLDKSSIKANSHDVTVRGRFFDKAKSDFTGGLFYTDLGGGISDEYVFEIQKNLFVSTGPTQEY